VLKNLQLNEIETIIKLADAIETKHPRTRGSFGFSHHASPVDSPDLKELEAGLEALPHPARMEMLALIWIARGDYRADAFEEALAYAREHYQSSDVRYLADKWGSLATYLKVGLREMPANWPANAAT
jgi:hypothetical protein